MGKSDAEWAAEVSVLNEKVVALEREKREISSERDRLEYRSIELQKLLEDIGRRQGGVNEYSIEDHLAPESSLYAATIEVDQSGNQAEPANFEKPNAENPQDYDSSTTCTYPDRPHFDKAPAPLHPATQVVIFDGCPNDPYHPSSMPIYQTATFVQPSISEFGPYDYTRSGNPTRTALEVLIAKLEAAHSAFAFSTGMLSLCFLKIFFLSNGGLRGLLELG